MGRISKKHIEAIGKTDNCKVVAVCDINEKKAKEAAEPLKVPSYTDYHEMINKENAQVIAILTEAGYHAPITIDIAKYGRTILVEKPMSLKLSDADKMIKACKNGNSELIVVKQNRYNKLVEKLKEAIDLGRFGKMVYGGVNVMWNRGQHYFDMDEWRGSWKLDGGVFSSQASHYVDLIQWVMGPVKSVYAITKNRLLDIEVEDTGVATLEFYNGALGSIIATNAAQPHNIEGSLCVYGEGGTVIIRGKSVNKLDTWIFKEKQPEDEKMFEYNENPGSVYGFGHIRLYKELVDHIEHGKGWLVRGEGGRTSVELFNAIYESAETGKIIKLKFNPENVKLGQ
jgi:predicted dehydrogenase